MRFREAPPPSKADVAEVAQRVRDRAARWLHRHGYIDERAAEERGNDPTDRAALDGCQQLAVARGTFLARPAAAKPDPGAARDRKERRFSASCDGFDIHCAVRIAADDDEGRERLIRCRARPPLSLDRIEVAWREPTASRSPSASASRAGATTRSETPAKMAVLAAMNSPRSTACAA